MSDAHAAQLERIPQWTYHACTQTLTRSFEFNDFDHAFEFMSQVAVVANTLNHHPDWCQHYNQVHVTLTTHEMQRVTELDHRLARDMDALYERMMVA